jgi:quercetin dioxygenase-like cupin family protein
MADARETPATADAPATPPVRGAGAEPALEHPFPGVSRRTNHTEQATVSAYAFEPEARFPIHTHPEEQITVVLEGTVVFEVEGERHALGPGETYAVAAHLEHGLQAGPDGARFLAVVVPRRSGSDAYEIKEGESHS